MPGAGALSGLNWALIDDDDGGNADSKLEWTGTETNAANASWGQMRLSALKVAFSAAGTETPTPTPTATSSSHADADIDGNSDGFGDAAAYSHTHSDRDGLANACADGDANRHPLTDCFGNSNSNAYRHPRHRRHRRHGLARYRRRWPPRLGGAGAVWRDCEAVSGWCADRPGHHRR